MVARDRVAGRLPRGVDVRPRIFDRDETADARVDVTSSASPARLHLRSARTGSRLPTVHLPLTNCPRRPGPLASRNCRPTRGPVPMAMQAHELRLDRVRQLLLPKAGSPSPGTGGAGASVGTVRTVEDCWTAKAVKGNKARMSPIPG